METGVRFGIFDFNPETGDLRRNGVTVKLQSQPAKVLALLVAHDGAIVSRESLQNAVWGGTTHVDFERGLNFCIAQVRTALGDSAESPRFIGTVPRIGYRFLAPITRTAAAVAPASAPVDTPTTASAGRQPRWRTAVITVAAAAAIAVFGWAASRSGAPPRPTIVVVPFFNETGRPELDGIAKSTGDATVARLATPERMPHVSVIGNAGRLQQPFARSEVQGIAQELGAGWVVIGQLKADGSRLRVIGHLIRAADMKHVWAQTYDDAALTLEAQSRIAEAIAAAVSHAAATN